MIKGISRVKIPKIFKSGVSKSVIWAASTFTGLTYTDNGGKVQLVSAGVHGLTTIPAVGSNVYVSWSGGTGGINGLYTVLSVDDTLKITIDLTYAIGLGTPTVGKVGFEITIESITIPPLKSTSHFNSDISFSSTSSANNKDYKVKLNGSNIFSITVTTAVGGRCLKKTINRGVTNSQVSSSSYAFPSNATSVTKTSVETANNSNVISILGGVAAANQEIILEYYVIEVSL